jgi:hypothetical protein
MIILVDFKNQAGRYGACLGRSGERICFAQNNSTVNDVLTRSITPSELPDALSISARGLDETSILHAAPSWHRQLILFAGVNLSNPIVRAVWKRLEALVQGGGSCFAAAEA